MSPLIETPEELAPRSSRIVAEHLQDVLALKALAGKIGKDDFVGRVRMKNILVQETALREELTAAELLESRNDLEISIDGDPVEDHAVSADFFGEFLVHLQEVAHKVTFAAGSDTKAPRKIPLDKRIESKMLITGWRASSFTVQLKLTSIEDSDDFMVEERRKVALDNLLKLFDDDTAEEKLIPIINNSGSKGVYKKLLDNIASRGATVKFRTKLYPFKSQLSPDKAAKRSQWMNVEDKPDTRRHLEISGILVAGNIDAHTFKIRTQETTYSGSIAKDAQSQILRISLSSRVNALIEEVTSYKTTADLKPSVKWTLESISEAPKETETANLFE